MRISGQIGVGKITNIQRGASRGPAATRRPVITTQVAGINFERGHFLLVTHTLDNV